MTEERVGRFYGQGHRCSTGPAGGSALSLSYTGIFVAFPVKRFMVVTLAFDTAKQEEKPVFLGRIQKEVFLARFQKAS